MRLVQRCALRERVEKPNVSRYHLAEGSLSQRILNGPMLARQERRQKAKRLSRLAGWLAKRASWSKMDKWSATTVTLTLIPKIWKAFSATSLLWKFHIASSNLNLASFLPWFFPWFPSFFGKLSQTWASCHYYPITIILWGHGPFQNSSPSHHLERSLVWDRALLPFLRIMGHKIQFVQIKYKWALYPRLSSPRTDPCSTSFQS